MKSLQKLRLTNPALNDRCMAHLGRLSNLTHIFFVFCKAITSKGFRILAELQNLKHLEIIGHDGIHEKDLGYVLRSIGWSLDTLIMQKVVLQGEV